MKRLTIILLAFLSISSLYAQYIYSDFDANQNEIFEGWPNVPQVFANPDPSGINTSAQVAQWDRSGEQWAHVFCTLDGKVDFETQSIFQLKVYSPIACQVLFKLEDQANGGVFTEVFADLSVTNQWVQLDFDFAGAQSGLYDKLVIFFDFATSTPNIFYFDDVEGPEYGSGSSGDPVTLPVTFDDDNVNYALIDFGGNSSEIIVDPTNAANKVAKSIKAETAELWAGTTVGGSVGFPTPVPFAVGETVMTVAVWSPTAGTPIRLKVEAASDPTISVETEVNTTLAEAWEVLEFDFSNEVTGTTPINFANEYSKASIFFNFGTPGAVAGEQTYYWDDMEMGESSGTGSITFFPANGATAVDVNVNPTLSFSVPVTMVDGSEILNDDISGIVTFKETDASGADIPFVGTINESKTLITIDPTSDLQNGQLYFLGVNGFVIKYVDGDFIQAQDVTFTTGASAKPYLALDVQDNFEDDGWGTISSWKYQDSPDLVDLEIVEDPINAANHVANYNRSGSFEWTNAQTILDHRMDLNQRNTFELKAYFPSTNDYTGLLLPAAAIKLQNSLLGPDAWTTQTEVLQTVTVFDEWITLTFNFAAIADSMNYDQLVVQFGGEGHLVVGQFYFDDLELLQESVNGFVTFYPADMSTDVSVEVIPEINFSIPVEMADGSEITNSDIEALVSFKENDMYGADVDFAGGINASKTQIILTPTDYLDYSQQYYLALNNELIAYTGGDLISGQSISFTTEEEIIVKPYLALDVQDNFEDDGYGTIDAWFFQDPEMNPLVITADPENSANHVADYDRTGSFEWANAQFILGHRMDLNEKNIFGIKVYMPSSNDYTGDLTPTVAIKLQNSLMGENAWSTQTEIVLTVDEFDSWLALDFDFSAIADSMNYDQVVVQLGGEGHFVPAQFYFDDIVLKQTVGLQEINAQNHSIYPNPATNYFSVSGIKDIKSVSLTNRVGQLVLFQNTDSGNINVSSLLPGLYSVMVLDNRDEQHFFKLIKQ